jgi:hypothetical protein
MVIERDRKLTIRISADEVSKLEALADSDGVTGSDVLRTFIRRAYAERFGEKKPKPKR